MSSSKGSKGSKGKKAPSVRGFLPSQERDDYFYGSTYSGSRRTQLLSACPELRDRVVSLQRTEVNFSTMHKIIKITFSI